MAEGSHVQRIAELEAELAGLRAEMQAFTATVSHDLRAPLRHIVSYAQMLQEDAGPLLNAEMQEFLGTITGSARYMGQLLDGLTALSRLGAAQPPVQELVSLDDAVQEACDKWASRSSKRVVDWKVQSDLPAARADAVLLQQVLDELLGNALKFSAPRERAVISVCASAAPQAGFIALQVTDNGVGFSPALQAKLFTVFGRLHSAEQFEGVGMGLVLARKRVERMGGTLDIAGVADGGCCVTLVLPAG